MKLQAAPSASWSETYLWAIAGHSLTLIRAREAFTCWNSSSGEKLEKEGADFGHWHQVARRTHSA
jgi:hypothetical protein